MSAVEHRYTHDSDTFTCCEHYPAGIMDSEPCSYCPDVTPAPAPRSHVEHERHTAGRYYSPVCDDCQAELTAVDWLMAVRKFGLATANAMFPDG